MAPRYDRDKRRPEPLLFGRDAQPWMCAPGPAATPSTRRSACARIHWQNLTNFGVGQVLPLEFTDAFDYHRKAQGDRLQVDHPPGVLRDAGQITGPQPD